MKRTIASLFACAVIALAAGVARAQVDDPLDALGEETNSTAEIEAEKQAEADADASEARRAERAARGNLPYAGVWGIGAVQTPSRVRGIEVEYYLNKIMISAVVGFQQYSPAEGESITSYSLGAGGFYELLTGKDTALLVGGRLVVGHASVADFSSTQINVEVPARLQWHFAKRLAVHFETGLVVAKIPENTEVVGVSPGLGRTEGIAVSFGGASLLGNAGLTLYF